MSGGVLALRVDPWDFGSDVGRFSQPVVTSPVRISAPQVSVSTTSSDPVWLQPTLDQFAQIAELGNDWDRRGSAEVRHDVLSFALRNVLTTLPPTAPAPAVIPLGHGGIQLVWNTDCAEIEVEVIAPNDIIAYHFDKASGEEFEEPLTNNLSSLSNLLWSTFTVKG
jgi:hypothetical protein